jgi:hypothetical protein
MHSVLFVRCKQGHDVPIGSLPDFRTTVKPEEIIPAKRENRCDCGNVVDVFSDELVVKRILGTDENCSARLMQACHEWAI